MALDWKTDRLIRRTAMVGTVTAAYFLLTADYGPSENVPDSIKRAIKSAEFSAKKFIFGSAEEDRQNEKRAQDHSNAK